MNNHRFNPWRKGVTSHPRTKSFPTALLLAAGLAACGGSSEPEADDLAAAPSTAQNAATIHAASEAASDPRAFIAAAAKPKANPACKSSAPVARWEDVTPLQMKLNGVGTWGPIVSNPLSPATLFVSLDGAGLVRSPDCGLSWGRVDDPKYGFADPTRSVNVATTMVIDPVNPDTLFMNNGYGQMGLFKSTNGGVDWKQAYGAGELGIFPVGGFTHLVTMDPTDPKHLVALPHFSCNAPQPSNCLLESMDSGATWTARGSLPAEVAIGGGLDMLDSKTWLFTDPFQGIYRTVDAGKNWSKVYSGQAFAPVYRSKASGGSYFMASVDGVLQSTDGISWHVIPGSPASTLLTGDGTRLFITGPRGTTQLYATAYEKTPNTWARMQTPNVSTAAQALFADSVNGYLYSSNSVGGVWRLRTK